jgi:plasmid stabilization system protein ParE
MEIRVELHPEAAAELQQAIDWYNNQFPALGSELLTEFDHAIEMICQHPLAWPQHIEGTRRFLLHRFPYGVVYHRKKGAVRILAIMHLHRRPGYWKTRG